MSSEKKQVWRFTFGCGQHNAGYCQPILGTFESAREKMFSMYGPEWCFQYSEKQWEDQANWQELVEELKGLDLDAKLCGVIHIINDGLADVVQSDETRILYGEEFVYEEFF